MFPAPNSGPDSLDLAEAAAVRRRRAQLQARSMRCPDPRDPDGLSDEEREELDELEAWSP